jgi:hypothetical protein
MKVRGGVGVWLAGLHSGMQAQEQHCTHVEISSSSLHFHVEICGLQLAWGFSIDQTLATLHLHLHADMTPHHTTTHQEFVAHWLACAGSVFHDAAAAAAAAVVGGGGDTAPHIMNHTSQDKEAEIMELDTRFKAAKTKPAQQGIWARVGGRTAE